jgi:hypothetical protein
MKTRDSSGGGSVIPTDREQGVCEDCHAWCPMNAENKVGECRLRAPQVIIRYDAPMTVWPWTKPHDWCCEGSFSLPERT